MPPRYFYPVVILCLVALTAALAYAAIRHADTGRYVFHDGGAVIDTRDGTICFPLRQSCSAPARDLAPSAPAQP